MMICVYVRALPSLSNK